MLQMSLYHPDFSQTMVAVSVVTCFGDKLCWQAASRLCGCNHCRIQMMDDTDNKKELEIPRTEPIRYTYNKTR